MVEIGGQEASKPIELSLTDPEIETTSVLGPVLKMLVDQIDHFGRTHNNDADVEQSVSTIRLLQKYEMQRELQIARLQLRCHLTAEKCRHVVFVLGACLEDHELCSQAISLAGRWCWLSGDEDKFGGGYKTGKVFDITTMPLRRLNLIPPDSLWALARASRKNPTFEDDKAKYQLMADEYLRLMKLRGESLLHPGV